MSPHLTHWRITWPWWESNFRQRVCYSPAPVKQQDSSTTQVQSLQSWLYKTKYYITDRRKTTTTTTTITTTKRAKEMGVVHTSHLTLANINLICYRQSTQCVAQCFRNWATRSQVRIQSRPSNISACPVWRHLSQRPQIHEDVWNSFLKKCCTRTSTVINQHCIFIKS